MVIVLVRYLRMINFSKEILTEGRYDSLTRKISNDIFYIIKQTIENRDSLVEIELPYDLTGDVVYRHPSGIEVPVVLYVQGVDRLSYGGESKDYYVNTFIDGSDELVMEVSLDPEKEPQSYENLYYKINEDIRHEIEHFTQDWFKDRPDRIESSNLETTYLHHKEPSEVSALTHGFYRRAKLEKRPLDEIMWEDLNHDIRSGYITQEEAEDLFKTWVNYARRRLPQAIYSNK